MVIAGDAVFHNFRYSLINRVGKSVRRGFRRNMGNRLEMQLMMD